MYPLIHLQKVDLQNQKNLIEKVKIHKINRQHRS